MSELPLLFGYKWFIFYIRNAKVVGLYYLLYIDFFVFVFTNKTFQKWTCFPLSDAQWHFRSSPWRFFSISRTMSWFSVLMCNLCIWTLTSLTSSWLKSYHGIYVLLYTWTLFPAAYTYNEFSLNSHLKYDYFDLFTSHGELCHWLYGKWHIILEMTVKIMRFVYFRWLFNENSLYVYARIGVGTTCYKQLRSDGVCDTNLTK
jgi:hypothetical protein